MEKVQTGKAGREKEERDCKGAQIREEEADESKEKERPEGQGNMGPLKEEELGGREGEREWEW